MSDAPSPPNGQRDIHCPQCRYRPRAEDRWSCMPSCGTLFHTFWTGGLCPGCGYAWTKTQCPACGELSPHRAWYHEPQPQAGEALLVPQSLDGVELSGAPRREVAEHDADGG